MLQTTNEATKFSIYIACSGMATRSQVRKEMRTSAVKIYEGSDFRQKTYSKEAGTGLECSRNSRKATVPETE